MNLPGCYKATVNESETITVAQPFCPARAQKLRCEPKGTVKGIGRYGFPVKAQANVEAEAKAEAHLERS